MPVLFCNAFAPGSPVILGFGQQFFSVCTCWDLALSESSINQLSPSHMASSCWTHAQVDAHLLNQRSARTVLRDLAGTTTFFRAGGQNGIGSSAGSFFGTGLSGWVGSQQEDTTQKELGSNRRLSLLSATRDVLFGGRTAAGCFPAKGRNIKDRHGRESAGYLWSDLNRAQFVARVPVGHVIEDGRKPRYPRTTVLYGGDRTWYHRVLLVSFGRGRWVYAHLRGSKRRLLSIESLNRVPASMSTSLLFPVTEDTAFE